MRKIFIPANTPEDWNPLVGPENWKTGYSAKSLAYCWQEANDFPKSVKKVFKDSGIELFQNIKLLLAFPEWKVPLRGGRRASQNDIFILAKGNNQLISITVEGKKSESFGEEVKEWKKHDSEGKQERLKFLCDKLQLDVSQIDHIRYQLLHRTVSAIIEAEKFNAPNALMLVHSFSQTDEGFDDYRQFLALFSLKNVKPDSLVSAKRRFNKVKLYFSWVRGDKKHLSKWWTGDLS